ncbi:hypothetical protein HanPSC8_Chr08g0323021 [Helianthus annuus]|nr:hypothetical protein HanPSC8_Chr08g0323021 [Helianthus annuus]
MREIIIPSFTHKDGYLRKQLDLGTGWVLDLGTGWVLDMGMGMYQSANPLGN